jgi:hypothetical protein
MNGHAEAMLDEFEVLMELPAKLAKAAGIVRFQHKLAV